MDHLDKLPWWLHVSCIVGIIALAIMALGLIISVGGAFSDALIRGRAAIKEVRNLEDRLEYTRKALSDMTVGRNEAHSEVARLKCELSNLKSGSYRGELGDTPFVSEEGQR